MSSRWYNAAVVLLWLSSMTWLVSTKLLPFLAPGRTARLPERFSGAEIGTGGGLENSLERAKSGHGGSTTLPLPLDLTQVRRVIHFDRLPLQVAPTRVRAYSPISTALGVGED